MICEFAEGLEWQATSPVSRRGLPRKLLKSTSHLGSLYTCWGGALDYVGGFGCRNGELVESSERGSESESYANLKELEKVGNRIFVSLLEFVGAKSPSLNFPPFERGYFPNT